LSDGSSEDFVDIESEEEAYEEEGDENNDLENQTGLK
jgi:hypothetical protein